MCRQKTNKIERPVIVVIATILTFICATVWLILTLGNAFDYDLEGNTKTVIFAINFFFGIFSIGIGIGLTRLNKWSFNCGLVTAVISSIWFGYNFFSSDDQIFFFLCNFESATGVLLLINKRFFRNENKKMTNLMT